MCTFYHFEEHVAILCTFFLKVGNGITVCAHFIKLYSTQKKWALCENLSHCIVENVGIMCTFYQIAKVGIISFCIFYAGLAGIGRMD